MRMGLGVGVQLQGRRGWRHLSDAVCYAHLCRCEDVPVHLTMPPGLLVLGGHL
jgi:hypothetical protein